METKKDREKDPESEVYVCEYCGAEYMSRSGVFKHEKHCSYRTDKAPIETDEKAPIALYEPKVEKGRAVPVGEDEDEYACPYCDATRKSPFRRCPECGEELEWPTSVNLDE